MNPQDSAPFFSRSQATNTDNPLSLQGRFGRLSSIGWYAFVHLITFFATIALRAYPVLISFFFSN